MSNDTAAVLFAAVTAAEDRARANHEAGICHLDEWSCTFCEEEGS